MDGPGSFYSKNIKSASGQTKTNKKTGEKTYYQQVLGAALIYPDRQEVIPLAPEMIVPKDGETKNDCERNAAKRWLPNFRQDHPNLNIIVTEDALSSNAPHIRDLQAHNMRFVLGVKEGDHEFLYTHIYSAYAQEKMTELRVADPNDPDKIHLFHFMNGLPLNQTNPDLLINFIAYQEIKGDKIKEFNWITDFEVTLDNVWELMRIGRARWKIENETFNILKNQGYNFEHNYGLGKQHLSEIYVHLMILAFLIDQVQQIACPLFRAVLNKLKQKKEVWEQMRSLFKSYAVNSIETIWKSIVYVFNKPNLESLDTS